MDSNPFCAPRCENSVPPGTSGLPAFLSPWDNRMEWGRECTSFHKPCIRSAGCRRDSFRLVPVGQKLCNKDTRAWLNFIAFLKPLPMAVVEQEGSAVMSNWIRNCEIILCGKRNTLIRHLRINHYQNWNPHGSGNSRKDAAKGSGSLLNKSFHVFHIV